MNVQIDIYARMILESMLTSARYEATEREHEKREREKQKKRKRRRERKREKEHDDTMTK